MRSLRITIAIPSDFENIESIRYFGTHKYLIYILLYRANPGFVKINSMRQYINWHSWDISTEVFFHRKTVTHLDIFTASKWEPDSHRRQKWHFQTFSWWMGRVLPNAAHYGDPGSVLPRRGLGRKRFSCISRSQENASLNGLAGNWHITDSKPTPLPPL